MTAAKRAPAADPAAEAVNRRLLEARARTADPRQAPATPAGALVRTPGRGSGAPDGGSSTGPMARDSRSAGGAIDDRHQAGGVVGAPPSRAALDAVERMAQAFRGGAWEAPTVITFGRLLDAEVATQGWTPRDIARGTAEMVRTESFAPSGFAVWRRYIAKAHRERVEAEAIAERDRQWRAAQAVAANHAGIARDMAFDPKCRALSPEAFRAEFMRRVAAKEDR